MIKNMNSDLAAAAQEAAAAAAVKAELESLAAAEVEFNRLYKQFGHLTDRITEIMDEVDSYNREAEADPSLDFSEQIEALGLEREELQATLDGEGAAYKTAKAVYDGLQDTKRKRLEKEANEARAAELAEAQAEATRELLRGFFEKKNLEAIIASTDGTYTPEE